MEIKLTDEQIEKHVQQSINQYVMSKVKGKIDKVIKDEFTSFQDIQAEMRESIDRIMLEKVERALEDKGVSKFIDSKMISDSVSEAVLEKVSEKIRDAVQDTFY